MLALSLSESAWGQCVPSCSSYSVSAITYSNFTGTGIDVIQSLSPTVDDGYMIAPLGFSFNYYCTTYTSVIICSNGFIQFDLANPPVVNAADPTQAFPSAVAPNGMVAFNMNDLDATSTGSITYMTIGTAPNRKFVVTWNAVPIYAFATSLNTGQIVLYETTNDIEIYTGSVVNNSTTNGTQGIENQSGSDGVPVPGRNNVIWSGSNTGYRFRFTDVPAPFTNSITGASSLCTGAGASYSTPVMPGALYYSWAFPGGWTGSGTTSVVSPVAGQSGTIQVAVVYTCGISNNATLAVTALPAPVVAISANSLVVCSGASISFTTSGAQTYTLQPGNLTSSNGFLTTPPVSTAYTLQGIDANNCISVNNPVVLILVNETPTVTVNSGSVCLGQSFTMTAAGADGFTYSSGFPIVTPPVAGIYNYSVVGTSTNGCVSDNAISTLTVVDKPAVSISANRNAICNNESVVLTASGADTYVWTNGPSTVSYTSTPIFNTTYTVTGTSVEGCVKSAVISIVVAPCTGIDEQAADEALLVYPNPSNGRFTVKAQEGTRVAIYDLQGRLVLTQIIGQSSAAIDLGPVSPGNYFLRATNGAASRAVILVKE